MSGCSVGRAGDDEVFKGGWGGPSEGGSGRPCCVNPALSGRFVWLILCVVSAYCFFFFPRQAIMSEGRESFFIFRIWGRSQSIHLNVDTGTFKGIYEIVSIS